MKLAKKITTEDFYEEYFNEYEDALKEFWGGQDYYSNGFEEDIYNYRQLIKFFGKNIVAEEQEADAKIKDAWKDDEDISFQYSHVRSLREFTLHATFISIHSMYEGRLREYCIILAHYGKVNINARKTDNAAGLINRINNKVRLLERSKSKKKLRAFYCNIRNKMVHHKSYLNSKNQIDLTLINQIKKHEHLTLTSCSVGTFDTQLHIKKSNFLTDYLTLIDQDLKLICRSAMKL